MFNNRFMLNKSSANMKKGFEFGDMSVKFNHRVTVEYKNKCDNEE